MSKTGNKFKIDIFGRSHGEKIGVYINGLPRGFKIDEDKLEAFMKRRAPGQKGSFSTSRKEADKVVFELGVSDGIVVSDEVCGVIYNKSQRSGDYNKLAGIPRPAHADFAAYKKYGVDYDLSGGGEFSGRLTAPLCIAGAVALQILEKNNIFTGAHVLSVGDAKDLPFDAKNVSKEDFEICKARNIPTLSQSAENEMTKLIEKVKADLDSIGGCIECAVIGMPAGVGGELFDGLESKISSVLFAIPAVKGVEFGEGFGVCTMHGSENNDEYVIENEDVVPRTNRAGGILGGITTGQPQIVRVAIKPTPSISKPQKSVNMKTMQEVTLEIGGRHDSCIVPRAVPVVEAAVAVALLDKLLEENADLVF